MKITKSLNLPSYITFEPLEKIITLFQNRQVAVLVDENTKRDCYPILDKVFENAKLSKPLLIEIPSGETNKTLETCTHIWYELTQNHFDRNSILLNLGGGVIGDMGGFCASTYKRGIDFIQIPTTLLSQVDASVGGKLGIDFNGFKNHIGLFQIPSKVWIHTPFLNTLPQNEIRSGFAEVIKHTLIADKKAWQNLLQNNILSKNNFENQSNVNNQNDFWDKIVAHSVALKAQITEADPTEKGLRKILNFGHTIGHAIESYFIEENKKDNNTKPVFLHGEAIALGMIAESYFSAFLCKNSNQKFISPTDFEEIKNYIFIIFKDVIIDFRKIIQDENILQEITKWAKQDKKNAQNIILTCALQEIGKATFDIPISESQILECLRQI
ncbi:3-dehydroquinate synthetase [Bernardetia litoralis DSM 6794]|uniref:3-dehydroquinate synthase n=1 Tax=Bernardetia litoralis (strain ATCC 23117 / DSM 6794 / NBRC 15988 / NCIMB 1366 / Fx l1 / Sio-4) TaxID=880071 RepID=I4AIW8_BERLS|nr:3-dehydroquinate synthase [Bernardetia litoralis]AFM03903.1 3-dehydroquinate synthetase [Bernardetia litoralis DSM 6794]